MKLLLRFCSSVSASGVGRDVSTALLQNLKNALEMAHTVDESAGQLLCETDPSNRQPRSFYVLQYQRFAVDQLESALAAIDEASLKVGKEAWAEILKERKGLAVSIADSKLVRDQLQASMRSIKAREAANQIDCPD